MPYSPEEIQTLFTAIRKIDSEVYQAILGHEQRLDDVPSFGLDSPAADYFDRLGEWIDYLMEQLSDDPEDDDINGIIRTALHNGEEANKELRRSNRTAFANGC